VSTGYIRARKIPEPKSVAIWERSAPWKKRRSTSAQCNSLSVIEENLMATEKQRAAARRNIKKAAAAAKKKRTIAHLPKRTKTALGKQAAKVARQKRRAA
jgi:hypothetical protein